MWQAVGVICAPYIPPTLPPRAGVRATRSANQSIPNTTITTVTWPTEVFDSNSFFTPGGSVFTVPAGMAGIYAISATAVFASAALGANFIRVVAGGVIYDFAGNTAGGILSSTIVVALAVAATVAVTVYHTNGGAVNMTSGAFSMHRIGL